VDARHKAGHDGRDMALTTAAAIYFIIWWVVLFAVLPFGVRRSKPGTIPAHQPSSLCARS
jgi:hypothetical protein